MQRSKKITVGDVEIPIAELSVAQIKDLMENMEEEKITTVDLLFPEGIPAIGIEQSTGISVKKLEADFLPSELKIIKEAVENLNPFFVNMMGRLAKIGETVLKEKRSMSSAAG